MANRFFHQWEPIPNETGVYPNNVIYNIVKCKQCVKCGLKKGQAQVDRFGSTTVYYNEDNNIISTSILPFECDREGRIQTDFEIKRKAKQFKRKLPKKDFLSEDEFYV